LWPGLLVENATQATAADFLRGTLVRLEIDELANWMPVKIHTHDEVLVETEASKAEKASAVLCSVMRQGFDWSEGLPLMSEETVSYQYTKHKDSYGL
jgi:DNA polymerase I-like protein with 3'-5' exonuclease and polymerase domains